MIFAQQRHSIYAQKTNFMWNAAADVAKHNGFLAIAIVRTISCHNDDEFKSWKQQHLKPSLIVSDSLQCEISDIESNSY